MAMDGIFVKKIRVRSPPSIMPVCLVGAKVGGRPNFEAIAWFTFLESRPVTVGICSDKSHYTNRGIRANKTFSVNIPSAELVVESDFCGLYSGSKVDKSEVFDVFYGELKTAPMISECPVNLECKLLRTVKFMVNEFFVGEVVEAFVNEECVTDGHGDVGLVDPLLYEGGSLPKYWKLGEKLARAFEIGKNHKPKPKQNQPKT
jgi:flavin reductase (DIM6/NTAB) family NADH-FMN oxidoreductase RutF